MRPAMIAITAIFAGVLAACGGNAGDTAGAERRTAAGEVLGGEVSDAMVPLDTVRSTSPAAPTATASGTGQPKTIEERRKILPQPEMSGGPEPLPSDPGAEDSPSAPQP